jgi:hypothetical protein
MHTNVWLFIAALLAVMLQSRPEASGFADEVAHRRLVRQDLKKGRRPSARLTRSLAAEESAGTEGDDADEPTGRIMGVHRWPDGSWAADAGVASIGCTRKGCMVGAFGLWWHPPAWPAEWDMLGLAALHGYGVVCDTQVSSYVGRVWFGR